MADEEFANGAQHETHEGVQALIDTHWNYSWSDLPAEQEKKIEEAFCLVSEVRDAQEREN